MNFRLWLEENELTIYLDLDETLEYHNNDKIYPRPHVYEFIKLVQKIAPCKILTHGYTHDQKIIAKLLNFHLPLIGRDKYDSITHNPNAILIDNLPASHYQTKNKLKALGIDKSHLIIIKPWHGHGTDTELLKVIKKIHTNEWVEPNALSAKQPFKSYNKARDLAEERCKKFYDGMKEAAEGHKVVVDIKTKNSFKDKTINRGKEPEKVYDVLRGAIIVNDESQIDKVVDNLKRIFLIKKVEHKTKPEKFGYYGAIHIDVIINEMVCEIQVMPKKVWQVKLKANNIYKKYRSIENPPKEKIEKSKEMFRKANE